MSAFLRDLLPLDQFQDTATTACVEAFPRWLNQGSNEVRRPRQRRRCIYIYSYAGTTCSIPLQTTCGHCLTGWKRTGVSSARGVSRGLSAHCKEASDQEVVESRDKSINLPNLKPSVVEEFIGQPCTEVILRMQSSGILDRHGISNMQSPVPYRLACHLDGDTILFPLAEVLTFEKRSSNEHAASHI